MGEGSEAQPLNPASSVSTMARVNMGPNGMAKGGRMDAGLLLILLEALLALGLFVFIVWWTLPKKRNKGKD